MGYIDTLHITNLRLGGISEFSGPYCIGTRDDWPILHRILSKGLAMISDQEKKKIHNHWVNLTPMEFYEFKSFWYAIGCQAGREHVINLPV